MWTSLIPNPLHPAIVHLPIALVILMPVTFLVAIVAIRRGAAPLKVWSVAAAVHVALVLSAWASLASGNDAGERVEEVIAEAPVESHEEAAEAFVAFAAGALVISLLGVRKDRIGAVARGTAVAASVGLVVAGWQVGHSGGQLVYRYGAASAYAAASDSTGALDARSPGQRRGRAGGGDDDDRGNP
jgi:hypothetical protein